MTFYAKANSPRYADRATIKAWAADLHRFDNHFSRNEIHAADSYFRWLAWGHFIYTRYGIHMPTFTDSDPRGRQAKDLYLAYANRQLLQNLADSMWDNPENVVLLPHHVVGRGYCHDGAGFTAARPRGFSVETVTGVARGGYKIVQWQHHDPVEGVVKLQAVVRWGTNA